MSFDSHPTADVGDGRGIGAGSRIGAYAIARDGALIGCNCSIGDHVVLVGPLKAGDAVNIDSYAYIGAGTLIENGVRIGPHVCICPDPGQQILIREGASIGAQATICSGVTIESHAVVSPGAVVTKNVPAAAVVAGNPAKIIGYASTTSAPVAMRTSAGSVDPTRTNVRGVALHTLPLIEDLRGNLSFGEAFRHVPFEVKRYFLTFDVATEEARGEHAHRTLQQFLICVHGRVHLVADDGRNREEFVLDQPNVALYLPPMVWGVQYRFSAGAVLLVLCSDRYDPEDYIRDYGDFLKLTR